MTKPKFYLTVKEVACVLGMSTSTVRSYCKCGRLTAYTDNGFRIIISSRELIEKRKEFDRDYDRYRWAMEYYGWKSVTKEDVYTIASGTISVVRICRNDWERWHNPNEDADPPDELGVFYSRIVHIVPMSGEIENKDDVA